MIRLLHDVVCWLLSVVLLLTNGWPVAIQHAHDVGDNPYHHSHRPYHHSHRTDRSASIAVMPTVSGAAGAIAGATEHVHMLWLGWELTILPPKGCRPNPCPSAGGSGMLAELAAKGAANGETMSSAAPVAAPLVLEPIELPHAATRSTDSGLTIAALPLCDTARHLRSGVQLA